jgi:TPR repeat protein
MKHFIFILFILLPCIPSSFAQSPNGACNDINIDTDRNILERCATDNKDEFAARLLGLIYEMGKGIFTFQDYDLAIYWYWEALNGGDDVAGDLLGDHYMKTHAPDKAIEVWKLAAKGGFHDDEHWYLYGKVEPAGKYLARKVGKLLLLSSSRYTVAFDWLLNEAKGGNVDAMYELSQSYFYKNDQAQFIKWASLAAQNGSPQAASNLSRHYSWEDNLGSKRLAKSWDNLYHKNAIASCNKQVRGRDFCMDVIDTFALSN